MKILHLTLKSKWFHMIRKGLKPEEYREIKEYWVSRFCTKHPGSMGGDFMDAHKVVAYKFKEFDVIKFTNGYAKNADSFLIEWKGIEIGLGLPKWGAELDVEYFVIKLGKIIKPTAIIPGN